ncbi:MAG: polysaccharide biosynthesis protein [Chloroflexi bacterium]|nr:polysaccharide biosynthesis protein [Chloroflexota bacterium]
MRNRHFLLLDIVLTLLSVAFAFSLRFDTLNAFDYFAQSWFFVPLLLIFRTPLLFLFGVYRRLWHYASVNEFFSLGQAIGLSSILTGAVIVLLVVPIVGVSGFPRSVILLEALLALVMIGGLRFTLRLSPNVRRRSFFVLSTVKQRVLVFGAGDAGSLIVREMIANPALGLEPIGFVDDDFTKKGMRIHNLPVLGDRASVGKIVAECNIDAAIVAMPTAPGKVIREVIEACRQASIPFKTIPGLYEILSGKVQVNAIRQVELEDLLRRDPVTIDLDEVGKYLQNARVLVTGAGGSIGSELCRQITRFHPAALILYELSENNLYQIDRELQQSGTRIVPVLGDVRDSEKIASVFARDQPQVVFHAAAHKHVPLTELNPDEVIANNVLGTRNLLDACVQHRVRRFVLISTDKAVNPRSVMGASKRVAEMMVQSKLYRNENFSPVAVRFGNVLGSNGSVVPLFKEQIAAGGPVTVTHSDMERYFMTIPEAVSLIIQAGALGQGGEIFVLDMGEPVKITDLAKDLIRLSGFEPDRDIPIVFTGTRPGEKLREELFAHNETRVLTKHPQIQIARGAPMNDNFLRVAIEMLSADIQNHDPTSLKRKLQEIVPEFSINT